MIDLKKEFFADTEIVSLLEEGGEDGNQAVEDFLYALLSLYETSIDGETLSQALIEDWQVFADEPLHMLRMVLLVKNNGKMQKKKH